MSLKLIVATLAICSVFTISAKNKVVYGEDNRRDIFEVSNTLFLSLARSTAGMVPNSKIVSSRNNLVKFSGTPLSSRNLCRNERYYNQMTGALCSGFLVAPNLLVTAGHCVKSKSDCDSNSWVFDYAVKTAGDLEEGTFETSRDNVYKCSKIISQSLDRRSKDDFSLILLKRDVVGRTPLEYRTAGKIKTGDPLVVIGHPTGLPSKIADGANVRNNDPKTYFQANLDTFGGNSGSPVFNADTGVVEGILVRGEVDYQRDWNRGGCTAPKKCSNLGCRGEDVTRITNIKKLLNKVIKGL